MIESDIAIECKGVMKSYQLYGSPAAMALDRFGLGALVRWRTGAVPIEFMALKGIDLQIRKGERVGIVGRNGAGKTTLLRLISGVASNSIGPTSGSIEVNGAVQALMKLQSTNPHLTGRENARAALTYNGLTGSDLEEALKDVIEFVELDDFIDRAVQTYSLGMAMRLNFAIGTALAPDILLVDEVLGAGDAQFAKKATERIRRLIHSGCTSIIVSHSTEQIERYCDRVIWLKDGEIALDGPASEVLAAYASFAAAYHASEGELIWRGVNPKLPLYVKSAFVERGIAEAEGFSVGSGEFVKMTSGGMGRRRFPSRGASVTDVRMNAETDATQSFKAGRGMSVEIDVTLLDRSASFLCALEVFALDGRRIARFVDTEPRGGSDRLTVTLKVDTLLLGSREYVGTVILLNPEAPASLERSFDVLSQVVYMPVANASESDPPFIHLNARWSRDGQEIEGEIGAVQ